MSKRSSAKPSAANTPGTQTPAIQVEPSILVLGVNFGESYSSVAIINKEGHADVIADEDGARQIANAVSFAGQEEYIGVPGRKQLIRNSKNTVLRFREMLGKSYEECTSFSSDYNGPELVNKDGEPAFKIQIEGKETILTAAEITAKFLGTLYKSAADFLGRKVDHVIFSVPADFSPKQGEALRSISQSCGVSVEQIIPEVAAAAVSYGLTTPATNTFSVGDRNILFLDVGASSTTATVVASRQGLLTILSTVHDNRLGGDQIDSKLVEFFSKEFTKKTKTKIDANDHRANAKLRLEVETTKRTLSASSSATIAIESLADGLDFSGAINRTRLDLLCSSIYSSIADKALEAVKQADLDVSQLHEVVLVGGTTKIPSLVSRVQDAFPETISITSEIEPDEVLAKGCALQAHLLHNTPFSGPVPTESFDAVSKGLPTLVKPIGILLGQNPESDKFALLMDQRTPLPARKQIEVQIPAGDQQTSVLLSFWEGKHDVLVEDVKAVANGTKANKDDDDDDDDDEEEPKRTAIVKASTKIADIVCKVDGTPQGKGRAAAPAPLLLTVSVAADASGTLEVKQLTAGSETYSISF